MTKQALIIPFLQVLGYDVFNPLEVKPEYIADFGKKKAEKVDYAIFKNDIPIMFIEAKAISEELGNHCAQLERYFNATPEVRVAILTNGIEYKFFTDLDKDNIMDENPFFRIDITNFSDPDIDILVQFTRERFDTDLIIKTAEELIYTSNLNTKLRELFKNPPDDFIRYLIKDFSDTRITTNVIDRFRPIVKKSISIAIVELVSEGLFQREEKGTTEDSIVEEQVKEETGDTPEHGEEVKKKSIITTEEELRCYEIIRTLLTDTGRDVSELRCKDTTVYFGIYNKNIFGWIVRINLDSSNKHILIKLPVEKAESLAPGFKVEQAPKGQGESRILIESPDDLVQLKDLILECFDSVSQNN
ncbi:MAG: type I restriction endonuclease [Syntrophaceticus sp.]|jgi:hypothetical protein|nr:type I restriction endonuclease [Syntrophaceticus sp.]MDD4783185.1 type I restriction endonuclease [Syntrophaceticus sp.]